jgi:hypothetical protein
VDLDVLHFNDKYQYIKHDTYIEINGVSNQLNEILEILSLMDRLPPVKIGKFGFMNEMLYETSIPDNVESIAFVAFK